MWFKHKASKNRKMLIIVSFLLIMGVLVFSGCVGTASVPRGWSGVTVSDDTIFLGSTEGKLVAIDASTHIRVFEDVPLETSAESSGGCGAASTVVAVYGSPVVSGELVFIGGYNGKIYAFNTSTSALRWVYPRGGNLSPIVSGPVVSEDKVYFGCSDGKVYALDLITGDKQWDFETEDKIWATPEINGDILYISSFDQKLYALDADTGGKKWEFETDGALASSPVIHEGIAFNASFDRHIYALDANNGSLKWEFMAEKWFWAKPTAHNNTVYAPCLDGKVYILNVTDGHEIVDAVDLGSPVSSSPVLIDDTVIIATEDGLIYSLDTDINQAKLLTDLEEEINSPLYASDGVIYIHAQENEILYALDARTGVVLWNLSLISE
ncbi:MAG: PQQ-binding-like beta-propeller repeat protein [Dehalococcoidales bacterium]|nr:PQQ-binding-like beta-propeller repeat protein [Dehalococcoidales bacterium]